MSELLGHTLLIAGNDRPGLIHEITGVLFRSGCNITQNHEYVDRRKGRFYMRTELSGSIDKAEILHKVRALFEASSHCEVYPVKSKKVWILVSKEDHCLGDLLLRQSAGELAIEILGVISQTEHCRKLTERFDVPFHHVPVLSKDRLQHERAVLDVIASSDFDYMILARYMRIFSGQLVSLFPNRIVNIHHSFLPAFKGHDPYDQAYLRGVKIIGATAHFVTEGLDEGPIICQQVISIDHSRDQAQMALLGKDVEKTTLARAIKLVIQDRLIVDSGRTIIFE